jgi:hypothetical protein
MIIYVVTYHIGFETAMELFESPDDARAYSLAVGGIMRAVSVRSKGKH